MGVVYFVVLRLLLWKISMVDIDEILAAAIRTAWLQVNGPGSRSAHHIEVARYVRAALEREGIIITSARPACGHGQRYALQNAPVRRSERGATRWSYCKMPGPGLAQPLLPIVRRPIAFAVRIMLA